MVVLVGEGFYYISSWTNQNKEDKDVDLFSESGEH